MIKIDFHIHTLKSDIPIKNKDSDFAFSLSYLKDYVKNRKLNCIAITNHNFFDISNYNICKNALNIPVFPGIELDFCTGHLLIICPLEKIVDFTNECEKAKQFIIANKTYLDKDTLLKIFKNYNDYLLIPHYDKKPQIPLSIIEDFKSCIYCGEVTNQSKFARLYKEAKGITPVLFSDIRIADGNAFSNRHTFLDLDKTNFNLICECLKNKDRVYFNESKKSDLFEMLDDGSEASTGLNIVIGKRSSGKTYTLNKIYDNFSNQYKNNIKYIKQFDLIEKENKSAEDEFNREISKEKSVYSDEYLDEFKKLVEKCLRLSPINEETIIDSYLNKLKKYAIEIDKLDSFAKVPIFTEQPIQYIENNEISELIVSVKKLLDANLYSSLIYKYIKKTTLIDLLFDLLDKKREKDVNCAVIKSVNSIINNTKQLLSSKSSNDSIPSLDLNEIVYQYLFIEEFDKLVIALKTNKDLDYIEKGKFKIVAKRKPFTSASDLKSVISRQCSLVEQYKKYNNSAYQYLKDIQNNGSIENSQIFRLFVKIEYQILNENNLEVSGGERSEYNLLNKLVDADNYEMLLIDEPESSFDNVFIRDNVNARIKELSKKMPVFVATHNSIIGMSIDPDYIIYNEKNIKDHKPIFSVYYGKKESTNLKNANDLTIKTYDAIIDCLEGGDTIYGKRAESYKNIKNQ